MKVYVITKTQGDYSDMRTTVFAIFQGKWKAEKYKDKAQRVFWGCYVYYQDKAQEFPSIFDDYTDEMIDLHSLYVDKMNKFYDCRFDVQEFDLRQS